MSKDIKFRKLLLIQPFGPLETCLKIETGNLLMTKDDNKIDKIPLYSLLAIFLIGRMKITTQFLKECSECGVAVYFLSDNFKTYARFGSETEGNYLLRQKQYLSSDETNLNIAKKIITQKCETQKNTLAYFDKDYTACDCDIKSIADVSEDSLLGIEGNISAKYFPVIFESMGWVKRVPQAKIDEVNLLMDIGYTMLFNLCDAMLSLFGFDSYKGVYHKLFFARKSLACDVMEPWRALIDATILLMYRQNIFHKKDFKVINSSFVFSEGYKGSSKYSRCFLKSLTSHKVEMFEYIRGYYFHVSNPEKYPFLRPNIDLSKISFSKL